MRCVLFIDKNEVKRYLRLHGGDCGDIDELIEKLSQKALETLCPKSVINSFEIEHTQNGIVLKGTDVSFEGNLVKKTFEGCDEIYVFAATLTLQSETLLKQCFAKSTVDGIVCDSVLTTMIEAYCDEIDEAVVKKGISKNKKATRRISCGYGDFSIKSQKDILDLLNAQKILGVKLNENNMIFPNKTVTAVMGLAPFDDKVTAEEITVLKNKCQSCCASCDFKR